MSSLMGNFTLLLRFNFLQNLQSHRRFAQKTIVNLLTYTLRRDIKPSKLGECIILESSKLQIPNVVPRWYFASKVENSQFFQMWQSFAQSLAYLLWVSTKVQRIKILIISPSLHVNMKYCTTYNERILKYYHMGNHFWPLWRSINIMHIYKSKLNFKKFKGCILSKVLCTSHFIIVNGYVLRGMEDVSKFQK